MVEVVTSSLKWYSKPPLFELLTSSGFILGDFVPGVSDQDTFMYFNIGTFFP